MDYDLTIRDLQSAWTDTVQQAMALCSALGAVYGLDGLPQTAAPAIDWGDGVLYDRARIWAEQRELVDAGLCAPSWRWRGILICRMRPRRSWQRFAAGLWAMQGGRNEPAVQCGGGEVTPPLRCCRK